MDCFKKRYTQELTQKSLVDLLTDPPLLTHFDSKSDLMLHTDASSVGLGAVLLQVTKEELREPVPYIRRRLTDVERKYLRVLWIRKELRSPQESLLVARTLYGYEKFLSNVQNGTFPTCRFPFTY